MKNTLYRTKLYYCIFIFVTIIIIDPTNEILGIKSLAFGICFIYYLFSKYFAIKISSLKFCVFVTSFIFYGILLTHIRAKVIDESFQNSFYQIAIFSLFILPLSQLSTNEILRINYNVGKILSYLILFVFIFYLSSPDNGALLYHYLMNDQKVPTILISHREFLGIRTIAFFYKTAPFLFFAILYKFNYIKSFRDYFILLILIIPIFITGSRTPTLCGLVILGYYFINFSKMSPKLKVFYSFIFLVLFIVLVALLLLEKDEASNQIKSGNLNNYIEDIFSSEGNVIIGSGIGSLFYNVRGFWAPYSELTYLDILRFWGLIGGTIFIIIVFFPSVLITSKEKTIRSFGLAYFLYMILAGTNPFLFSSTGWFCFMMGYTVLFKNFKIQNKVNDINLFSNV